MTNTVEHLLSIYKEESLSPETTEHYDIEAIRSFSERLLKEIEFYWNEDAHLFSDYGAMTFDNETGHYHYGIGQSILVTIVGYTNHKGYVSLFPFLFGTLSPSSPHLKYILDDLTDPAIVFLYWCFEFFSSGVLQVFALYPNLLPTLVPMKITGEVVYG